MRLEELGREKCVAPDTIEVWVVDARRPEEQDHPPLGQARRAPERSQRPASRLRLYLWRDLPKDGEGAALVLPRCNTEAMNLRLAEIATRASRGAHAALLKTVNRVNYVLGLVSVFCAGPWPIGASLPACPFRILSRKGALTAWRHKATNLST